MDISKSLFSLVKFNAGKFKSQKQADFLLSHFADGVYASSGKIYNSSYTWLFHANVNGIFLVEKSLKSGLKTYWELSETSVQDSLKACNKAAECKSFVKTNEFLQYHQSKCMRLKNQLIEIVLNNKDDNNDKRLIEAYKSLKDYTAKVDNKFNELHGF